VPGSLVGEPVPSFIFGGQMERSVLVDLFILFAAAKILGEVFDHVGLPSVVGELLGGILVGPNLLGWLQADREGLVDVVAELGVIVLMFGIGLEVRVADLRRVGRPALMVGTSGMLLRAGGAVVLFVLLGYERDTVLFVAAALAATSIAVTARVLRDHGAVTTEPGRVILGAAVIDDILSLVVLSVVAGVAAGRFSSLEVGLTVVEVVVFLMVVLLAGPRVVRWLSELGHLPIVPGSPLVFTLLLTLGLAALSSIIGLAAIIGAFLAGVIVEFRRDEIRAQIEPVGELLVPFFFAVTGSRLDPGAFSDPGVVALTAGAVVVVVGATVGAGWAAARGLDEPGALTVGVGMIPRGEVTLIAASVGLGLGVVSEEVFAVLVAVTVVTSLIAPPLLSTVLGRRAPSEPGERDER
jgi:Kef-type K+ transport system membrane component KefB